MAAPLDIGRLFDLGIDILGTTLGKVSGVILAQTGDSTAQRVKANKAEWWQTTGFASRPALPSQGGASCQGLAIKCSDRHIVFATRDVRGTSILGNLADGEACVYAPAGMGAAYFKKSGAVFLSTTDDNTPAGNQILLSISPVAQGGGKGGEIRAYCASVGGFWYDASGYHSRYWFGGSDDMGVSSIPGVPVQTTTRTIGADFITLNGAFVTLGNGALPSALVAATQFGAVVATPLSLALAALAVALTDVEKSLSTLGNPAPSIAAAVTLLGTAVAGLTSAAALPSSVATACTTAT